MKIIWLVVSTLLTYWSLSLLVQGFFTARDEKAIKIARYQWAGSLAILFAASFLFYFGVL